MNQLFKQQTILLDQDVKISGSWFFTALSHNIVEAALKLNGKQFPKNTNTLLIGFSVL